MKRALDDSAGEALLSLAQSGAQEHPGPAPQISVRGGQSGDARVIELVLEGVLVALVEMRLPKGLSADSSAEWGPARVVVTGCDDVLKFGIMQPPPSHVFHAITAHAAELILRLGALPCPRRLPCLVRWVCAYQDLFSAPCVNCGRLLQPTSANPAILLPPTLRTLDLQAYHVA